MSGRDPGFFALDRPKLRAARRRLRSAYGDQAADPAGVLVWICEETALTGNYRDLAEEWGCGAKWLAVRLVKLEEAGAITWVKPCNQYA